MATTGARTPQVSTAAPGEGRLARGVLNDFDIASATLADMAPAMSFYFAFATIVVTAG
ncbi:MAG: hypothetical protein JO342_00170, partial [Solirubrobacterales bacterium]|nr:hypothetical protein [Solirubrobacterales bacterium]